MLKNALFALFYIGLAGCATEAGQKLQALKPALEAVESSYEACISDIGVADAILPIIDTRIPENLLRKSYFTNEQFELTSEYMAQEFSCFSNSVSGLEGVNQNAFQGHIVDYAEALSDMLDYLEANKDSVTIGMYNRAILDLGNDRNKISTGIVQNTISALEAQDMAVRLQRSQNLSQLGQAMRYVSPPISDTSSSMGGVANSGIVCFSKGEQQTGLTKQCIYDCLGQTHIVTMGVGICPLTINK